MHALIQHIEFQRNKNTDNFLKIYRAIYLLSTSTSLNMQKEHKKIALCHTLCFVY